MKLANLKSSRSGMSRPKMLLIVFGVLFACDVIWRDASIFRDMLTWRDKFSHKSAPPAPPSPDQSEQGLRTATNGSGGGPATGEGILVFGGGGTNTNAAAVATTSAPEGDSDAGGLGTVEVTAPIRPAPVTMPTNRTIYIPKPAPPRPVGPPIPIAQP